MELLQKNNQMEDDVNKSQEPRRFELRIYTLPSKDALDFYKDEVYPRHLKSFPLFGV
jgi:hypothetical protein